MLRNFPGRTLEELDQMDWGRYLRALEAAEVERVERLRVRQIEGKLKSEEIDAEDWATIQAHDGLMSEESDGGE